MASAELRRIVLGDKPGFTTDIANSGPNSGHDRDLQTFARILAREESVWYLCSTIHAGCHSLSLPTSAPAYIYPAIYNVEAPYESKEIVRAAREMLMEVVIADRSWQSNSDVIGVSVGKEGNILSLLEREMIFGVIEAANRCCDEAAEWGVDEEVHHGQEAES